MDGLKVGDQIIINNLASGEYVYSLPGSIGIITYVSDRHYIVHFPDVPQCRLGGWAMSKIHCESFPVLQGPPEHPVIRKIKQMELRHKKRMEKKHADALVFF